MTLPAHNATNIYIFIAHSLWELTFYYGYDDEEYQGEYFNH